MRKLFIRRGRVTTLALLLVVGIVVAGTTGYSLRHILNASAATIRFAVIGDFGLAGQPEADVANLVKNWNPSFILTIGDNNYELGEASTIDANIGQYYHDYISPYTGSYGSGSASGNRFFPTLGNHD